MPRAAFAIEQSRLNDRTEERALITRVLSGDRVAARQMYDAHAPRVHRLIYRFVGDTDLAKELTQDTFVRAFAQLGTFRGDAALSTWLRQIAVRTTSNGMRKVKTFRRRETDLDEAHPIGVTTRRADPDLRARLASAIDALPDSLRLTVVMHDIEGYTHAEIATAMGVAEGTCKSRLFDARAVLRKALAEFADFKD